MPGFNNLTRQHRIIEYGPKEQNCYKNLEAVSNNDYGLDTVFISDDSECNWSYRGNSKYRKNLKERRQFDVISHQYVIKYANYPAMGIILFREPQDKPFSFWDLLSVVRYYLNRVGYKQNYSQSDIKYFTTHLDIEDTDLENSLLKSFRVPPITWVGYFNGVDITAYSDWKKHISKFFEAKHDPSVVTLHQQEFFSFSYPILINNPNSRRIKYPAIIKFVDTMSLGPNEGGLKALAAIVGQKSPNINAWNKEDFSLTKSKLYYQNHLRELLNNRPDDYVAYALNDPQITLKYLDFFMGNVNSIFQQGLIPKIQIPSTLNKLGDQISSSYSKKPYDPKLAEKIFNDIFQGYDINRFLRPGRYNQRPPKDQQGAWSKVIQFIIRSHQPAETAALRTTFIKKLKPYLSRGSIQYHPGKQKLLKFSNLASNDYNIDYLVSDIESRIDFKKLYDDNPNFKIKRIKTQKVVSTNPSFDIPIELRNRYADHAHQFSYTQNNIPLTIEDFLLKMYDDCIYDMLKWYKPEKKARNLVKWTPINYLSTQLDFDKMRKGYHFLESQANSNTKHKRGAHDLLSVHPDSVFNSSFEMARLAYVGGMNLSFNSGIIDSAYKYKYDIDLKASYVDAGHLIPDFRLDTKPLLELYDLKTTDFKSYVDNHPAQFPNGAFTVGVANISYYFPSSVKRVPVGYKSPTLHSSPRYVRQCNSTNMTLTDVWNIIRHGGYGTIHKLFIPQQKKLSGDESCLAPIGRMQNWSLLLRNKAIDKRDQFDKDSEEYQKYDSLQLFYKLLGNGGYGKSGQGLGSNATRDFQTNKVMSIPFSQNTNPYVAAQYTSIARYQVNYLMDLFEVIYPHSLIPSVTTDGFIFCTNDKFDEDSTQHTCGEKVNQEWHDVNHAFFDDKYFELKSHNEKINVSTKPLFNIKTRFNLTQDNLIKALVGLSSNSWTTGDIINKIKNDEITFETDNRRILSLNDMKHDIDQKHYDSLRWWEQPKYLNLAPDDTYKPIKFVPQGDFGYYITRPFSSIDDMEVYKKELRPYRFIFPAFRKEFAEAFMSFNQNIQTYNYTGRIERHVIWVHDDVLLKGKNYPAILKNYNNNYVPKVFLRYIAHHQNEYDLEKLYQEKFADRSKYTAFKQKLKRLESTFVNEMCVIKENFGKQLQPYKKRR